MLLRSAAHGSPVADSRAGTVRIVNASRSTPSSTSCHVSGVETPANVAGARAVSRRQRLPEDVLQEVDVDALAARGDGRARPSRASGASAPRRSRRSGRRAGRLRTACPAGAGYRCAGLRSRTSSARRWRRAVELVADPARDVERPAERQAGRSDRGRGRRSRRTRATARARTTDPARSPRAASCTSSVIRSPPTICGRCSATVDHLDRARPAGTSCDAMLIERLGGDAVRKALHHERAVGHRRQDERRDLRVVAEQVALGQLLLRPEHLVQVGHRKPLAARQVERAVAPCVFERAELIDEGGRASPGVMPGAARAGFVRPRAVRRYGRPLTSDAARRTPLSARGRHRAGSCRRAGRDRPDAAASRRRSTR